jgi:hypothetical protein
MTAKERIQNHPLVYLISSAVLVSTIVAGVLQFLCGERVNLVNRKYELELNKRDLQIASIRRGLEDKEYLDIRTFIHPASQKLTVKLPKTSKYFEHDGFYASGDQSHWSYEKTTEAGLFLVLEGRPPEAPIARLMGTYPLHLWRSKSELSVEGHPKFEKLFPFITLERIPTEVYRSLVGIGASLATSGMPLSEQQERGFQDFIGQLDKTFRGDVAGTMLAMHLSAGFLQAVESPQTKVELVEVQKVGNVVYLQWLTTLKDVVVAGDKHSEYFLREEYVIVSTPESLYLISVSIPSTDPTARDPAYRWVDEWFADLAIFVE